MIYIATSIGQIGLDLVVNENGFKSQMNGILGIAKKAGAAMAAAFGVKKLIDFGKQCLELGSDLAEVQNVVDVTFPAMSAQVDKFAKGAAQSFGLSETMAKRYTGTFGAMAKAFGFTESQAYDMGSTLTKLTGDVASFYNLSQDEAYTKLKSVFTGETESLKDLGVVMTQTALDSYAMANGFGKTTSAMSEAEKVALRYQFVQDQLSAAQGDFARTSDSWANQVRILTLQFDSLKATIGQGLINLFTPIIKVINTVIGKLATLANAFKSFTELITGQKSSAESSSVAAVASAATDAGDSLSGASDAAGNLTSNTNKAGKAAENAAKKMKSLMGFDKINKVDSNDTSTGSSGSGSVGSGSGAGGLLGSTVDFGGLAQGETVLDKTDKRMAVLIKRAKELVALFKKGFKIGFGDSEKQIKNITAGIKNIKKSYDEIFSDSGVVKSANDCINSVVQSCGKIAGSITSVGVTLAANLIGGLDKYLSGSKEYIKGKLVSIFDITGNIIELAGNFTVAFADIFSIFAGPEAQGITADLIGIFSDGFLGVLNAGLQFISDVGSMIIIPIQNNVEGIKAVLESLLGFVQIILDTLYQSFMNVISKISEVYGTYIAPFVDSVVQGISDIAETMLNYWSTYIAPVLDSLGTKFQTVWQEHVQPALDGIIELLGKVFENLQALWETLLVPLIEWIINNILPVIQPILTALGDAFLDLLELVGDVTSGITDVLGGLIDFCTGAFTGDFDKCFKGLEEILSGFKKVFDGIFEYLRKNILEPFDAFLSGIFSEDWSKSLGLLGTILNGFFDQVSKIWDDIKNVFDGIVTFIDGVFSADWKKAWEGITDVFSGVFSGIVDIAKVPLNAVIGAFNGIISIVNSLIGKINGLHFRITVPDWVPGVGGKWWGFNGFSIPTIGSVPMLANGAYVRANTPQLAMIGDNRHQGEFVAPEDKLQEMALQAASMAGGGISKADLEALLNRAVMRIVAALAQMGFYMDSKQVTTAVRNAMAADDVRHNTVEVM